MQIIKILLSIFLLQFIVVDVVETKHKILQAATVQHEGSGWMVKVMAMKGGKKDTNKDYGKNGLTYRKGMSSGNPRARSARRRPTSVDDAAKLLRKLVRYLDQPRWISIKYNRFYSRYDDSLWNDDCTSNVNRVKDATETFGNFKERLTTNEQKNGLKNAISTFIHGLDNDELCRFPEEGLCKMSICIILEGRAAARYPSIATTNQVAFTNLANAGDIKKITLFSISGNSVMIKLNNDNYAIFDTGMKTYLPTKLAYYNVLGAPSTLKYVFISHFDEDHSSGVISLNPASWNQGADTATKVFSGPICNGQKEYDEVTKALVAVNEGKAPNMQVKGQVLTGEHAIDEIYLWAPGTDDFTDCNSCSALIFYKLNEESDFLFLPGDMTIEEWNRAKNVDFFKNKLATTLIMGAPHHGSHEEETLNLDLFKEDVAPNLRVVFLQGSFTKYDTIPGEKLIDALYNDNICIIQTYCKDISFNIEDIKFKNEGERLTKAEFLEENAFCDNEKMKLWSTSIAKERNEGDESLSDWKKRYRHDTLCPGYPTE